MRRFDWQKIAYDTLVSRALDDVEETTNKHRSSVPKDHLVLYQFSARGHDMAQAILGSLLTGRHDAAGAYYRSRPLLLSLGLSIEDALASPLGRSGGFSDGRDIGVVCNLPKRDGPIVLPMSGDVGSQYTPSAGWAQAITYYRDTLEDKTYAGCMSVALGGEASVATNGFWSALTMATTLKLPMLFYIEDNGLGISVRGEMQTPGGDIARNLASFSNLFIRDGDGTDPEQASRLLREVVDHVRAGKGPALVRLTVPRLCSHSGPDNQKGYRSDAEIAADDEARSAPETAPLPRTGIHVGEGVGIAGSQRWRAMWTRHSTAARARPAPEAATVKRFIYAEPRAEGDAETIGGLSDVELAALGGSETPAEDGDMMRFAEAVRRTLKVELARNPKVLVFGEDVGRQGRRASRHRGSAEGIRRRPRVRHESVGRGDHRPRRRHGDRGTDAGGRDPVSQVRRSGHRAAQQLRHLAVAHGQPVRGADRGAHARRIRQGRGRSVAQSERRGAVRARHRVAGGHAVERGRRGGAVALGHAGRETRLFSSSIGRCS